MDDAARVPNKQIGQPRLDRRERLRHRFYEPLCMLWILNPSTGHGHTESSHVPRQPHDERQIGQWRSFLDALSWFGDHKHGGASVSAIAAEERDEGVQFWVCSRFESSAGNISRVISECSLVSESRDSEMFSRTLDRVIAMGVWFARERVKSYQKDLSLHLKHAMYGTQLDDQAIPKSHNERSLEDAAANMHQILQSLLPGSSDQVTICRTAYDLASCPDLKRLSAALSAASQISQWAKVRHCVIRLGSWHRKAGIVLRFAQRFPQIFAQCSSCFLPLPKAQRLPLADDKTHLRGVLTRMLPAGSEGPVTELHEQIQSFRGFDFEARFTEFYSDQNTRLVAHAETFLLEHFYFQSLQYVWQDKFIGCSKSSCYCCHLYQRFHPDNPVLRPAHGTAWHRWAAPITITEGMDDKVWRHHRAIINGMNQHIRRDVLAEIRGRMPRRERLRDSTSAVTGDIQL